MCISNCVHSQTNLKGILFVDLKGITFLPCLTHIMILGGCFCSPCDKGFLRFAAQLAHHIPAIQVDDVRGEERE
jgi:hypothetical protein